MSARTSKPSEASSILADLLAITLSQVQRLGGIHADRGFRTALRSRIRAE